MFTFATPIAGLVPIVDLETSQDFCSHLTFVHIHVTVIVRLSHCSCHVDNEVCCTVRRPWSCLANIHKVTLGTPVWRLARTAWHLGCLRPSQDTYGTCKTIARWFCSGRASWNEGKKSGKFNSALDVIVVLKMMSKNRTAVVRSPCVACRILLKW